MTKPTPKTGRCPVLRAKHDVNALLEPLYYIRTCIEALKKLRQATQRSGADPSLRHIIKTALEESRAAERCLVDQVLRAKTILTEERNALWEVTE